MSHDTPNSAGRPPWLTRLAEHLSRWDRPVPGHERLEPALAARELLDWSRDAGRWHPRAERDWRSLLDDVISSWSRLGPRLQAVTAIDDELAALRAALSAKAVVTPEHRSTILRVAQALDDAFDSAGALRAAVDDVWTAAERNSYPESLDEDTVWRLAILASVGERRGHDWAVIAERVHHGFEATSEQSPSAVLDGVHLGLEAPPGRGHSVVWLAVDHASYWGQSPNPLVQLVDGDWLLAVLRDWHGPRAGVPPELAADPQRLLDACPRFDEQEPPDDQLPVSFARIDIGEGPTAGARERARDILELLIARASALQGGTNWKVSGVCLHFVDGELVYQSVGPIGDPDIYQRLTRSDVLQDETGAILSQEADRLRSHLPVADDRLHAALELARWLTQARASAPAARLVLSGRVLEQAANWAGITVPSLVEDHLSSAWAWERVAEDLSRAGTAAVRRLPGADGLSSTPAERQAFLEVNSELIDKRRRGRACARPWLVLARLEWLTDQHAPASEIGDYLRELQQRLRDGPSAAAWIDELRADLRVLNARAVRTRNAIVHGGPLIAAVAYTVVDTQDALARQALDWVTEALAAERTLDEVFGEHRARQVAAVERLRSGDRPIDVLVTAAGR